MIHNQSFWEAKLYGHTYDLIIIGGGLTGLSTALFFKRKNPNASVLVVDRGFFPIGASTRNAGFACIGTIGEHLADLEIDSEERLKQRIKDRYEGLLLLRETLGEKAIEYQHTGGWELFSDPETFGEAEASIEKFNGWMEELFGEKNLYEAGSYNGFPSIFNRCEGMLHPGKMIKKLYEMNIELGVEFRWSTPVQSINANQSEVVLNNEIVLKSEKLVVATNAFTKALLPEKGIKPGRGYVFVTNELESLEWKGTFHYDKGYIYFRNLGDRRLLLGGGRNFDAETEETVEFGINEHIKSFLLEFAEETLRLPKGWKVEQEWSGIMGFTESKSAIFEKVSDRCLVAAGLSGMGVALGMQLGKKAAKAV